MNFFRRVASKYERGVGICAVDMVGIFYDRGGDGWSRDFLGDKDVSWRRGPIEGEEVIVLRF